MLVESDGHRPAREHALAHKDRFPLRELTLGFVGKEHEEEVRRRKSEHGVSEEFETLVRLIFLAGHKLGDRPVRPRPVRRKFALDRAIDVRSMTKRADEKRPIAERIPYARLEIHQTMGFPGLHLPSAATTVSARSYHHTSRRIIRRARRAIFRVAPARVQAAPSVHERTRRLALWPPKPNELLSATVAVVGRATCGT